MFDTLDALINGTGKLLAILLFGAFIFCAVIITESYCCVQSNMRNISLVLETCLHMGLKMWSVVTKQSTIKLPTYKQGITK